MIRKHWNLTNVWIPGIYTQPQELPIILPNYIFKKIILKIADLGTPLLLLDPLSPPELIDTCRILIQNSGIKTIFGFPYRDECKGRSLYNKDQILFLQKITQKYFFLKPGYEKIQYPYALISLHHLKTNTLVCR